MYLCTKISGPIYTKSFLVEVKFNLTMKHTIVSNINKLVIHLLAFPRNVPTYLEVYVFLILFNCAIRCKQINPASGRRVIRRIHFSKLLVKF